MLAFANQLSFLKLELTGPPLVYAKIISNLLRSLLVTVMCCQHTTSIKKSSNKMC